MKKCLLLLFTAFLCCQNAHAQQQNKWRNYLDAATLSNSEFVKSGEYLWIGTNGGLLRYNTITGNHNVFQPDSCAMKGVKIASICSDSMGGVWFSTNIYGLQHFDGTTFRWFSTKNNGEELNRIRKIQLDKQGRLWMLNQTTFAGASPDAEILMFQGQQWTSYARDSVSFDYDFAVDKDGICWNYRHDYPREYILAFDSRNGQIRRFDTLNSPLKLDYYAVLRTDNLGNVWAAYTNDKYSTKLFLHQLTLQNWRAYPFTHHKYIRGLFDFTIDNNGGMHIVTEDDYYTFKDSSWTVRGISDYLYWRFMYIDATKSWAIGVSDSNFIRDPINSLIKIEGSNRQKTNFSSNKILKNPEGRSFPMFGNEAQNNILHCRTFDFDGRQFKPNVLNGAQGAFDGDSLLWEAGFNYIGGFDFRTNTQQQISSERILPQKILVDKFANKWVIGYNYKGIYTLTPNRSLSFYNFQDNGLATHIRDFAIDTSGNIWVISDSGLIKRNVNTQTWAKMPMPDSIKPYSLEKINIDEGNHIWLDAGYCILYSESNGLKVLDILKVYIPSNDNFENKYDRFVAYRNGIWWFVTYRGLVRYDGVNYQTFDALNSPMPTKRIAGLFSDRLGNLWMNHPYGLTVYNERDLVDLRTSSKEITEKEAIAHRFSPNPMSHQGILTFQNPTNSVFKLRIFTAHGQILEQQTTSSNQFLIQNKGLAAGIYFYQIENNGKLGQGKFVVQ